MPSSISPHSLVIYLSCLHFSKHFPLFRRSFINIVLPLLRRKIPSQPSLLSRCVSKLSNAMRFVAASTSVIQSILVQPMAATRSRSRRFLSATLAPGTRSKLLSLPASSRRTLIPATQAKATKARTSRKVFVGNDSPAYNRWAIWRRRPSDTSWQAGGEERRWQYAMRISASVFGAPVTLP